MTKLTDKPARFASGATSSDAELSSLGNNAGPSKPFDQAQTRVLADARAPS